MKEILWQFQDHARRTPDQVAIAKGETALSYRQLDEASNHLARILLEHGRAQPLAHYGPVGPEQAVSIIAAHKIGAPFIAVDKTLPLEALQDRIETTGVSIVTRDAQTEMGGDIKVKQIVVDCDARADFQCLDVDDGSISHIRFTSGSTGKSKGVRLSRGHVERMTAVFDTFLPADPQECFGLVGQFWPMVLFRALATGARLVSIDFRDAGVSETRRWLRRNKVTALFSYPQAARSILHGKEKFCDISYLHVSGDALSAGDMEAFAASLIPGARVHNSFGASEFPWIAGDILRVGDPIPTGRLPLGRPVFPGAVKLVKADGTLCAPGETGEIVIAHPDLPDGYLDNSADTARTFENTDGARILHTGDMAYADKDGTLFRQGRGDDMIPIRGSLVWPAEIEATLETHVRVDEAAIKAFKRPDGQPQIAAYYTGATDVPQADLRAFLKARLPQAMIPALFIRTAELPRTASGKIQRHALPPPDLNAGLEKRHDPPVNAVESAIADVWKATLGIDHVSRSDDFRDLGGDSLLSVNMLARLEEVFERRIPIDILTLEGPTVTDIARWLGENPTNRAPVLMRAGQGPSPLFLTPVAGGHLSDYVRFLEVFDSDNSVFGLRPRGLLEGETPDGTMPDFAKGLLASIGAEVAPFNVMGYSFGALAAYELAYQACRIKRSPANLILIDPPMEWNARYPGLTWLTRTSYRADFALFSKRLRYYAGRIPSYRKIDAAHLRAALGFRPQKMSGVRTLLITSAEYGRQEATIDVWKALLAPNLQVTTLPMNHLELMRAPRVAEVAQVIRQWLRQGVP